VIAMHFKNMLYVRFPCPTDVPSIEAPPPQEGVEKGRSGTGSSNPFRDFMLKSPESSPYNPPLPPPSV